MLTESDDIAPDDRKGNVDFSLAANNFQKNWIRRALKQTNGVKRKAAAILQMNRTTLVEEIKIMGLELV